MADYTLEEKDSFTVLGIGTELKSDSETLLRQMQQLRWGNETA